MKAETALVTINGQTQLKVLLIPEDQKETKFLLEALDKAESYKVTAAIPDAALGRA